MRQASTMHSQPSGAALSGDYMTPHRQPGDGNSATNPRVVRSALEQLLESATPSSAVKRNLSSSRSLLLDSSSNGGSRLGHEDGGSSSRSTSSYKRRGFTVSYATAPPSGGPHSDPPSDRGMSSSPSDGDDGVGRGVESVRRNSAHMPLANDRGIASLFGVPRRASDAASARASPPPSPSVDPAHAIPQTSRSLLPEVEQAAGMDGFGGAAMKARRSAAHDSIHGRMFSEEEVGERVRTALQKYEETRDSEEAIVLQGVQEEVERHAERYSSLLAIHNAMKTSNQELQDRLEQVMEQCSSQTQTINELRGEQRGMIEKLAAMEVQLSHAHDTKTVQANVQEEEWAAERARWTSEAEQLRARLKALTGEVESKSSALDALSATVRALEGAKDEQVSAMQQQHLAECEEIKSKMQSLGGCMTKMEQTLRKKDEEISRLKGALMEAERATHSAGESSKVDAEQAASRIVSLETALHVQTDEVRRRMHAQQVLQEEKKTLQVEMKRIQAALHQSSERQQNGLALLRSIFRSMSGLCRKGASTLGGGNTTPRQGASQEQLPAVVRAEACAKASMDATMAFESVDPSDLTSLASLSLSSVEEDAEVLRGVENLIPSSSSLLATARHRRTASAIPASRVGARRGASADEAERPSVRRLAASIDGDLRNMSHGFAEAIREAREMQRGMVALGAHLQETTLGWKRTRSEMESKLEQEKARAHSLEAVCRNTKLRLVQQESALEDFAAREHDWVESEQRTSTHAKDMEAECEELRSRLSEVEAQRDQTEARIREVELELKRSVESMEALKMELRTAQSVADERSSMETYIATITVERNEAKELLAKEQGRANKLTQAMRRGDEEREALKRELAELKEKIKTCHEQLQASRAQVQARRAKEERETHDREVELAHLRESLAVAQSLTESAKSSAADERTRMTAATSAMKEKVAALEAAVYQREASIQEMRVAADLQQETEKATLRDVYNILREVVHARPEESMLVDDCSSPADFFSAAEEANLAEATVAANTTPLSPSTERVEQARLASRTPSKAREGHLRHPHMDRVGQSLSPSTLRAMPALALRHQVLCLVQRAACALARPPAPAASVVVASDGRGWSSSPERRSLFASPLGRHAFQRMEAALPVEEHQRRTMADVDGANMTAPYVGDVADEWDGYTSRLAQEEVFYPRPLSLANSSPSPRPPSPEAAHHSPDEVCPSCRTHAAATSTRRLQPSPRPESSPTESSFILYKSSRSPSVPVHKTRQAFGAPTQILRDRAPNLQPPATAMKRGSFKHGASSTAVLPRQPSPQKASPAEHRIGLGVLGDGTVDGSCSPARPPAFRA